MNSCFGQFLFSMHIQKRALTCTWPSPFRYRYGISRYHNCWFLVGLFCAVNITSSDFTGTTWNMPRRPGHVIWPEIKVRGAIMHLIRGKMGQLRARFAHCFRCRPKALSWGCSNTPAEARVKLSMRQTCFDPFRNFFCRPPPPYQPSALKWTL